MDTSSIEEYLPLLIPYALKIVGAIVVLLVGRIVAGWARKATSRSLTRANVDEMLTKFFARAVGIIVMVFVILAVLGFFGIKTTSIVAVLGAAGLAVGLALQGTLSNFAAGVMLLLFRPFKVGDAVKVSGEFGIVDSIGLFTTQLDTPNNRRIIVPNSKIFGETIENVTHHPTRRVDINVGTDYPADLTVTRSVLEKAAAGIPGILTEPPPQVFLSELGDSSINWQVRVWTETRNYWNVWQSATEATKRALDAADIGIPFPQMDVHLDRVDAAG